MGRLAAYAPTHMLPHLGLRFTKKALTAMGVNVSTVETGVLQKECWMAGA